MRFVSVAAVTLSFVSVGFASVNGTGQAGAGEVVTCNRASGDLSVIDAATLSVTTVSLPDDAEPMYVNQWDWGGKLFVGDRANDRVIVLDDETYAVLDTIPVGAGVFHQWIQPYGLQLWVVGDIANAITVVNPWSHEVLATIPIPTDVVQAGGRPHDVFVAWGQGFVSIIGMQEGLVLRFDAWTFEETHRANVGGDPHLFLRGAQLYVASQAGSSVTRFRPWNLTERSSISIANAHGIWVTPGRRVLTTNIGGGGLDALFSVRGSLASVRDTASTDFPTPHNVTVDGAGGRAFITHSGASANRVSIVELEPGGRLGAVQSVVVGTNPFGLALVD